MRNTYTIIYVHTVCTLHNETIEFSQFFLLLRCVLPAHTHFPFAHHLLYLDLEKHHTLHSLVWYFIFRYSTEIPFLELSEID